MKLRSIFKQSKYKNFAHAVKILSLLYFGSGNLSKLISQMAVSKVYPNFEFLTDNSKVERVMSRVNVPVVKVLGRFFHESFL